MCSGWHTASQSAASKSTLHGGFFSFLWPSSYGSLRSSLPLNQGTEQDVKDKTVIWFFPEEVFLWRCFNPWYLHETNLSPNSHYNTRRCPNHAVRNREAGKSEWKGGFKIVKVEMEVDHPAGQHWLKPYKTYKGTGSIKGLLERPIQSPRLNAIKNVWYDCRKILSIRSDVALAILKGRMCNDFIFHTLHSYLLHCLGLTNRSKKKKKTTHTLKFVFWQKQSKKHKLYCKTHQMPVKDSTPYCLIPSPISCWESLHTVFFALQICWGRLCLLRRIFWSASKLMRSFQPQNRVAPLQAQRPVNICFWLFFPSVPECLVSCVKQREPSVVLKRNTQNVVRYVLWIRLTSMSTEIHMN